MSLAAKIRSAPPELIRLWVTNIWYSRDTKICDVSLEDISFEDLVIFLESAFHRNEVTCKNFVQQVPAEYAAKFLHAILVMDSEIQPILLASFEFRELPVRVIQNFLTKFVTIRPLVRVHIFIIWGRGLCGICFRSTQICPCCKECGCINALRYNHGLIPTLGFYPFQECFMERSDFAIRRFRSHWWNLWRIFLTYIHKSAQCSICAKSVICRQRRRCILCNSQEKILIFLGTAQLAVLF